MCYQIIRYCILRVREIRKKSILCCLDDVPVEWVYEHIQAYKYLGWCSCMVLGGEVSLQHGSWSIDLWLLQCRTVKKQTHSFIKIVLWIHVHIWPVYDEKFLTCAFKFNSHLGWKPRWKLDFWMRIILVYMKSLVLVVNGHQITGVVYVVISAIGLWNFVWNKKSRSWKILPFCVFQGW